MFSQKKMMPLDKIVLDKNNVRRHDEKNIKAIMKSLERSYQRKPIVMFGNTVIAGNGTVEAARRLGWKEIWVNDDPFESEEAAKAYALADNRTNDLSDFDEDKLKEELADFEAKGWDLEDLGWDSEDLKDIIDQNPVEGLTDEDEVPETKQNEFNVQLGDIWQLGSHRLMCGDSTDKATVEKLMNGEKADMVFTDPPYGMSAVEKSSVLSKRYKPILGDSNTDVVKKSCVYLLSLNIPTILWGANYYSSCLPDASCWIVWDKNNGGSDQTDCELAWTNFKGVVRKFTQASEKTNRVHPTQKPINLMEFVFNKYEAGKIIIDLFLGSGSTMIACEKTGRKCYGMELDPHYCSVIIKRWQDFTGKQAVKL